MVVFTLTTMYIGLTLEFCPFFWDILDNGALESPYFLYISFFVGICFNYFILWWKEAFNNNKDIFFKFFALCSKTSATILTLILAEFKRFIKFLNSFKYKNFTETWSFFVSSKWNPINVLWKPLFKKWSYFGYFKTNRSKWWKNK